MEAQKQWKGKKKKKLKKNKQTLHCVGAHPAERKAANKTVCGGKFGRPERNLATSASLAFLMVFFSPLACTLNLPTIIITTIIIFPPSSRQRGITSLLLLLLL